MQNNFKKMVHNPKSSISDKKDESDCCKERKEYYVTQEECDWIKYSACEKWLHETAQFSSKPASTLDVATFLRVLKNVRNLQRSKESHNDREHILFDLKKISFTSNLLFRIAICVGHFSPRICQRHLICVPS
jgi:hypothetical protein